MTGPHMQLEDWLDDLCVRFIINLPEEDLSSVARICFQVEEAQWFYEDFIRPLDPSLPSMSLRTFCLRIFQHCPLLASFAVEDHTRAFEEFLQYKTRVPVRGAILLNHEMDSTVLVKGWKKGANWSFPRGKINKNEDDLDCAVREVWEETGLDLRAAGLVPSEGKPKYIEINMREQQMRLYVFRDVPMDTNFQPQTRKEISKIQWYKLAELPAFRKKGQNQTQSEMGSNANKFYMVAPFLVPLKKWVGSQKKNEAKKTIMTNYIGLNPNYSLDEAPTEDDAWPQPATELSARTPAINTLEGATNELQRLLKVYPATQDVQSPGSQEDKARALLSMLRVKDTPTAGQQQTGPYLPQTPHGLSAGEATQPRNPHHHTNNQQYHHVQMNQPPPPFDLQQQQQSQPPQWHGIQHSAYQGQPPPLALNVPPQHAQLQTQRSVISQSAIHENPLTAPSHDAHYQPPPPSGNGPAMPAPAGAPPNEARKPSLSNQSMALLSAFKRDTGKSPQAQPMEPAMAVQNGNSQSQPLFPPFPSQPPVVAQNQQRRPSELAGSVVEHPPSNGAPARTNAAADQHRSTLLGMFKNDGAGTAPSGMQPAPPPAAQANPANTSQQLLSMFRREASGADPGPKPEAKPAASNTTLAELFAVNGGAGQPKAPMAKAPEATPSGSHQPGGASRAQPSGFRILQRGQTDIPTSPGLAAQPGSAPSHAPYPNPPQTGPGHPAATPPGALPQAPPAALAPSLAQPQPPQDQRRQLLSLFGKQQAAAAAPSPAEVGAGPATPARSGSETPMSPADQTFLLDYLQSVTKAAPRQ